MTDAVLTRKIADHVTLVTINRPDARNAVNGDGSDFGDRSASTSLTISAASDPTPTPPDPPASPTFTPVPTSPAG